MQQSPLESLFKHYEENLWEIVGHVIQPFVKGGLSLQELISASKVAAKVEDFLDLEGGKRLAKALVKHPEYKAHEHGDILFKILKTGNPKRLKEILGLN